MNKELKTLSSLEKLVDFIASEYNDRKWGQVLIFEIIILFILLKIP